MATRPWTKVWTKILDNTFLMSDNNAYLVFTKLILIANNSGEHCTTTREFAQLAGLSYSAYMRTIDRLEAHGMIERFATERGKNTILKIKKWKTYQGRKPLTKDMGSTDQKSMFSHRKPEQQPEQPTADIFERVAEQETEQQSEQRRSRGGAEQQKLQGSKKPLDIRVKSNTHVDAKKIVQFYNQVFSREILELPERLKQIETRLRTFTARDIAIAIKNASQDDFFNGSGPRGWIGDLDYLVRDNKNLEKYINLTSKPRKKYA